MKVLHVRIDEQQRTDLDVIARVRGVSIAALVREAIDGSVRQVLSDPTFRAQLDQLQADERAALRPPPG